MKNTDTPPRRPAIDTKIVQHVQRHRHLQREIPAHVAVGTAFDSPTGGRMRRDGSLIRFLDLTREA